MNTYLFMFYPNLRWQLVLIFLLGILYYPNKYQFIVIYVLILSVLLFFYRKPWDGNMGVVSVQICNIDGTCRELIHNTRDIEIWAPSYGVVKQIVREGDWIKIVSILTVLDVHAQYAPVGGNVENVKYYAGKFTTAGLWEKTDDNERQEMTIRCSANGELVRVKQIAGVITRRITSGVEEGQSVERGDYIGFIHLGSRVDLYLPVDKVDVVVKEGDRLEGFNTIVATWK